MHTWMRTGLLGVLEPNLHVTIPSCISGKSVKDWSSKSDFFLFSPNWAWYNFAHSYALRLLKKTHRIWNLYAKLTQKCKKVTVFTVLCRSKNFTQILEN